MNAVYSEETRNKKAAEVGTGKQSDRSTGRVLGADLVRQKKGSLVQTLKFLVIPE